MSFLLSVTNTLAWKNPFAYNRIFTLWIGNVFISKAPGLFCFMVAKMSSCWNVLAPNVMRTKRHLAQCCLRLWLIILSVNWVIFRIFFNLSCFLVLHHFINMAFCQLAASSTCHFINWPLHQLGPCYFINLPLYQLAISSIYNFINLLLRQLATLSTCHFTNLPLHLLATSSTCYFINLPLHQLATSSTCNFSNLSFHQLATSSTWHFLQLEILPNHPKLLRDGGGHRSFLC